MDHKCHAVGCEREVPPAMLMCARHWRLVPGRLKLQVLRHYRKGQEISKNPSREYLEAARSAIEAVRMSEGR